MKNKIPLLAVLCVAMSYTAQAAHAAETNTAANLAGEFPKGAYGSLNTLPDWGGAWFLSFAPSGAHPALPKLKGKYLEAYEAWQREVKTKDGEVPRVASNCTPPGMPVIMGMPQYPIEFLFTPGRVTIHHEAWMQWRNIFTDGRKREEDLDPTFQGDSLGRWQGDTLIVETIGIKDLALTLATLELRPAHGPNLRITERIHLDPKNPDTLIDEMTLEDPDALEEPYQQKLTFKRSRHQQLLEFVCAENDRNPIDSSGNTQFNHQ